VTFAASDGRQFRRVGWPTDTAANPVADWIRVSCQQGHDALDPDVSGQSSAAGAVPRSAAQLSA
jgi:hypothetical protein